MVRNVNSNYQAIPLSAAHLTYHPRIKSIQLMGKGARVMAVQSNAREALAFYSVDYLLLTRVVFTARQ